MIQSDIFSFKNKEIIKPLLRGRDLEKWKYFYKNLYLLIIKYGQGDEIKNNYESIFNYLKQHETKLKNRGQVKNGQHHWLELDNNPSDKYIALFEKEKLIYPNMASGLYPVYDNLKYFTNQKCFILTSNSINLKYLNGLLASNVINFIFSLIGSNLGSGGFDINKIFVEQLPLIIKDDSETHEVIIHMDELIKLNNKINSYEKKFLLYLKNDLNIDNISKKLEKFYGLSEKELIKEIKKYNKNFDENKLLDYFNNSKRNILLLLEKILIKDSELNKLIYKIYKLNKTEIEIIENHLK